MRLPPLRPAAGSRAGANTAPHSGVGGAFAARAARACPGVARAAATRPPRAVAPAASNPPARQRAHLPPLDRHRPLDRRQAQGDRSRRRCGKIRPCPARPRPRAPAPQEPRAALSGLRCAAAPHRSSCGRAGPASAISGGRRGAGPRAPLAGQQGTGVASDLGARRPPTSRRRALATAPGRARRTGLPMRSAVTAAA